MTNRIWIRRALLVGLALVGLGALGVGPVDQAAPVAEAAAGLGAGGEFHPLPPKRVFDSRGAGINDPAPGKKRIDPRNEFRVQLAGLGGLPSNPAEILAVVASVTVVEPDGGGWLAVRPTGTVRDPKDASLVNFAARRNVPNLAITAVGADGAITVTLGPRQTATAHVIVDVSGWISTSASAVPGARLINMGPARLIDTREPGMGGPLGRGQVRPIRIRGANTYSPRITIPNNGTVTAALVNILAVNTRAGNTATFLSASPARPALPVRTSNVNVVAGQVKANLAIVPVGPDGNIYLYNHSGVADVVIDVFGYFQTGASATTTLGRVVPLAKPFRAIDTREPVPFGNVPLGSGSAEDWSFNQFANSVSLPGVGAVGAQGSLIGNLTATDLRRVHPSVPTSTYLTAYPVGVGRPLTSNLNLAEREVVANMSVMPYGTSGSDPYRLRVYNHGGSAHYVLDVYAIVLD